MAAHALLVEVRLLTDRYHGTRDWPPSPFRVFQALIAGAYSGRWTAEERTPKDAAFQWLEGLFPPVVAAPRRIPGRSTTYYVPNNDLDAKGGDPRRAYQIRAAKLATAQIIEPGGTLLYAWPFDDGEEHARTVCDLATRLHTLGWGIDAASARAAVVSWAEAERTLTDQGGVVSRPAVDRGGPDDPTCPVPGSLSSLKARVAAHRTRFDRQGTEILFRQPPKAVFTTVAYERRFQRFLFELRNLAGSFRPIPQASAGPLAATVRRLLRARLATTIGDERSRDLSELVDEAGWRIRVIPLPTVGHERASGAIRRVLVEVPPECPIAPADVAWALSGQSLDALTRVDEETGDVATAQLISADDHGMLRHYGVGHLSRRWRTVTPIAIDVAQPTGRLGGQARADHANAIARAVTEAVRRAGLPTSGLIVNTQREPFHAKGCRADRFIRVGASDHALLHAELIFQDAIRGPLVLGDGEFDGLGIFRPTEVPVAAPRNSRAAEATSARAPSPAKARRQSPAIARFVIEHGPPITEALRFAELARKALMSKLGNRCPPEISGRSVAGPLHSAFDHGHAFYIPEDADDDGMIDHLIVYCPPGFSRETRRAMDALTMLWSGRQRGEPSVGPASAWRVGLEVLAQPGDIPTSRLLGTARVWTSVTPYLKPRFDRKRPRDVGEQAALYETQIVWEWRRRFPAMGVPNVEVLSGSDRGPALTTFSRTRQARGGHQPDKVGAFVRLHFAHEIRGPIALGKHAHLGMGIFERERTTR